ncbi:AmmeMemoRadiSam system radical SAM enzyme [Planctomycetales bacterium]|nr:AmmeMemoRadiSam system radical SAM enzyme [Planctomycetales bacterium]
MLCDLCPRHCSLSDHKTGFCGVRKEQAGKVVLVSYGQTTGFAVDPIEKKPLNHFYPGSSVLSLGSIGCNLACRFCQNASSAQSNDLSLLSATASPRDIVQLAKARGCIGVAFTYNEPIISAEFVQDVAAACRDAGLKTAAVSNGYISGERRAGFFDLMNAANIDLKSFSETFYKDYCSGSLEPVKDTLRYLAKSKTWLEITTLLIPTLNDSDSEITQLARWIVADLGKEIPLHFSAFFPRYRLLNLAPTEPKTLFRAREIALAEGLRYVYTGNIEDAAGEATYCPQCGQCVISRCRYRVDEYHIDEDACCRFCGQTIAGCFAE